MKVVMILGQLGAVVVVLASVAVRDGIAYGGAATGTGDVGTRIFLSGLRAVSTRKK
jgi:hypothetical protein